MTATGEGVIGTPTHELDELRRTNAQLAQSQRVAGIGSWELDPAAGTVTCSDQMYRLFGVDPTVFRPSLESFFALVHPDDQASVSEMLARATATKAPIALEHRIVRPDGAVRIVRLNADVTLADDGSVALICGTDQDITDLKAVEDELRRQHETLALVTHATNDAVWERSFPDGMTIWHHGLEAYGYTAEAIASLAGSAEPLIHPDDLTQLQSSAEAAVASGQESWSCRFRLRRSDGSYAFVLARAQIVRDRAGAGIRMVGSLLDLTEQERATELGLRNAAVSEVLGRASHELRTPLNAILGFAGLLEEQLRSTLTERQGRYLQNVRTAGEQLLVLIDQVLDLGTAVAGEVEPARDRIGLQELLMPVREAARLSSEARGISFSFDGVADPQLELDAARVRRILLSLLSNAVKFTPLGGRVTLRATVEDGALGLQVSDTGMGIPAELQDRVFAAFERLHSGEAPGAGLGLALARQLVTSLGGSIAFLSVPGEETVFSVVLPGVAATEIAGDRVLVVEDRVQDAELIVELVNGAGLATEIARTLDEARGAIARARPRAIVLDLHLPDGRGEALLDALRSDPLTLTLPVIVVTGADADRHRVAAADEQLVKPLDHSRLRAWLARVAALPAPAEPAEPVGR